MFAKKSVEALLREAALPKEGLKRSLSVWNLTALGIGAIVGAGLFVLSGEAAANYAGPAVVLSFIFAAIICFFAALCYAEFASMIPIAGSAYTYTYVTLGDFSAWIMGWVLTLEFLFSAATVAVGWSSYLGSFLKDFGITLPHVLSAAPFKYQAISGWEETGAILNLPAMAIMALMGYLIYHGVKTAARFNDIMVFLKLAVIVIFIALGVSFVQTENFTPFIPENTGVFGQFGWSGVFRGAGIVFFAFIGFDAVSTMAQEAKKPKRDMPIGMIGSLGVSTLIYIAVALVMTGIIFYKHLGVADPMAVAINAFGPKFFWLRYVLKLAILAGLTSVVLVMTMGQTRIYYAMAHDGLLPKTFGKIHKKYHTPHITTLFVTLLGTVVAGLFPVGVIGQIVSMGTLFIFGTVCLAVLSLRYTHPEVHRPFKVPLVPLIPALGILSLYGQMFFLPGVAWLQFLSWIAFGCLLYFFYGRKNSLVRNALHEG